MVAMVSKESGNKFPMTLAALVFSSCPSLFSRSVYPAFPDANGKIAFTADRDGDREIFVMNDDGSNQIQLTFNTASDRVPAWSPDGLKLAFESDRDGDAEIFVMNRDGSD